MNLNPRLRQARDVGERHAAALQSAYVALVRATGRMAAERFTARATLVAAANWQPPDISDVMGFAVNADRVRAQQRSMLAAISGSLVEIPGITFDALQAPTQKSLNRLGLRAEGIGQDLRGPVVEVITHGWAEGWSVKETAAGITRSVNSLAPWQSVMLARTDLIALSNAANHAAVRTLNDAARESGEDPTVRSRTWLSSQDSKVRETHAEADGQTVPMDQPYNVGGFDLDYPGDPGGPDGEVINCRCTELFNDEAAGLVAGSVVEGDVNSEGMEGMELRIDHGALSAFVSERMPTPAPPSESLVHSYVSSTEELAKARAHLTYTEEMAKASAYATFTNEMATMRDAFLGTIKALVSGEREKPVVNVHLPEQVVHVASPEFAPQIVVQPAAIEAAAPVVNVTVPEPIVNVTVETPPRQKDIGIERDSQGRITGYRVDEEVGP